MKPAVFIFTFIVISAMGLSSVCAQTNGVFNVRDFNAIGLKEQTATVNIQNCIDTCHAANGGIVYFPPGEYTAGTLILKDNVILHLESGAVLYASRNQEDYSRSVQIYANGAKNIGIMGKGKIDGQAVRVYEDLRDVDGFIAGYTELALQSGVEMKRYYYTRPAPRMVHFVNCSNIVVRDVSLVESSIWTLHIQWCDMVFIDNIHVRSNLDEGVNADGIDIDGSRNVVITNCIVETGDDAIVLKTSERPNEISPPCENVTVSNCVTTSTSTALKLGTESYGDFRHIVFSNCVVRNSNRGLGIVIRDGASVENVIFSDITIECNRKHFNWWGNGDPIWVVLLKRNDNSKLGSIKNVTFNNIIAYGQGTSKIEGYADRPLENIKLSNVQIFMGAETTPDKRAAEGFLAHHVNGLSLFDCQVNWSSEKQEPKWSNAFSFSQIENLRLDKLSCSHAPGSVTEAIRVDDSKDIIIERCYAQPGTGIFLGISGPETRNVILGTNYLQNASTNVATGSSFNAKELHRQPE